MSAMYPVQTHKGNDRGRGHRELMKMQGLGANTERHVITNKK